MDSDNRRVLFHYNGVEWTENYKGEKNTYFKKIRANQKSNKTYYIFGLIEDVNTLGLYSYQDGNMNEIYRIKCRYKNMLMMKNEICIITLKVKFILWKTIN